MRPPAAPTARAGTNMPVLAPTPFVQIMPANVIMKNMLSTAKSKWKVGRSWGSGSPRCIIMRRDCDSGWKKSCSEGRVGTQQ